MINKIGPILAALFLFLGASAKAQDENIGKVQQQQIVRGTLVNLNHQKAFELLTLTNPAGGTCSGSMLNRCGAITASEDVSLGTTFTNSFPQQVPGGRPVFIYVVNPDGRLMWLRHNGAERGDGLSTPGAWVGPRPVGRGWNETEAVFGGGGNSIYLIGSNGLLKWYRHNGFNTGAGLEDPSAWSGQRDVGRGWQGMQHVFSGGNGIIYTIADDGILRWYKHHGFRTGVGLETPGAWEGPKDVGRGWQGIQHVFSGGDGIIYTISDDGILRWYRHNGFRTGAGLTTPGAWEGPKNVGRGWGNLRHVFSGGRNGIIYTIADDGILRWYKHNGFRTGAGLETLGAWEGPKDVGRGWGEALHVFALMPSDLPPVW